MKQYFLGVAITLIFFLSFLFTLSDYGMHEDSPFHFLRGQYYLEKILKGEVNFSLSKNIPPVFFVPGQRISLYKPNGSEVLLSPIRSVGLFQEQGKTIQEDYKQQMAKLDTKQSFYKHNAWTSVWETQDLQTHPAVSDILMALSNRIFYEQLEVLPDIEAYHLYIVFISSLCLFFVYLFSQKAFGKTTALFAAISLALFPLFFAEAHYNIKDQVQMGFFTISLISFYFWVENKFSLKWMAIFILSTFLALGTKWNIFFLPIIILPWILLIIKNKQIPSITKFLSIIIHLVVMIIIPFILLIAAWPFLWSNPFFKLTNTFDFYAQLAFKNPSFDIPNSFPLPLGFNALSLLRVISVTPPVTLFLFGAGLLAILAGKIKTRLKAEWLVVFWLFIPIVRASRQWVDTTGSIRQFVEFLPALAIISGLGAQQIIKFCGEAIKLLPRTHKSADHKIFAENPESATNLRIDGNRYIASECFQENFRGQVEDPERSRRALLVFGFWSLVFGLLLILIVKLHPNQNVYFNFIGGGLAQAKKSGLYSWQGSYDNVYRQGVNWLNRNALPNAKLAFMDGTMLAISPLWLRDDIRFGSYFSGFEQKGEYIISLIYPIPPSVFEYIYLERFLEPLHAVSVDGVPLLKIWQNHPQKTKPEAKLQRQLEKNPELIPIVKGKGRAWEINLERKQKITRLILTVPKNCTPERGIWSTIKDGQETLLNPRKVFLEKEKLEIDFPAEEANSIRFWDMENNSCLYQSEIESIFVL